MSGTIASGTLTLPATGSQPAKLSTALQGIDGLIIRAKSSNSGDIEIGQAAFSAGDGFTLAPGESLPMDILNASVIWVRGTQGDKVSYLGVSA